MKRFTFLYFSLYILTGTDIYTSAYVSLFTLFTAEVQSSLIFKITVQECKVIVKGTRLRYTVFMAVRINVTVFLDVTPCSLVNTYCYFEGTPCLLYEDGDIRYILKFGTCLPSYKI
jgi:hypothetical protein